MLNQTAATSGKTTLISVSTMHQVGYACTPGQTARLLKKGVVGILACLIEVHHLQQNKNQGWVLAKTVLPRLSNRLLAVACMQAELAESALQQSVQSLDTVTSTGQPETEAVYALPLHS